jgi:hypothetical protein
VRVAVLSTYFRVKENDLGSVRPFHQASLWYRLLESKRVLQFGVVSEFQLQGSNCSRSHCILQYRLSDSLRSFFGDTLAGIQHRISGPSPTGRSPITCHPCHAGKQTCAPFRAQPQRPDLLPLAVLSSDTARPIRPISADGALHFGTLVDKATRFTLGKALPRKRDAAQFCPRWPEATPAHYRAHRWPLPLGRRKGADYANSGDLPASARDRDYNNGMVSTDERPDVTLHVDNNGAIDMAHAHGPTKRTKHLDVRHHYLQQCVARKALRMRQCTTGAQLADCLTKPLGRVKFLQTFQLLRHRD